MSDNADQEQGARAAVMNYLEGTREASGEKLEAAFYSSVNLHSVDGEGRLDMVARDRFIAFAGAGRLPPHSNEILGFEVIGDMAWAKVRFDLPDREFFDVLTLLRLNTGWTIVSKTYTTILK
ncbi:MAG: nuclear transport factor 2 family protein [Pseudomonadota bacterium]